MIKLSNVATLRIQRNFFFFVFHKNLLLDLKQKGKNQLIFLYLARMVVDVYDHIVITFCFFFLYLWENYRLSYS